MQGRDALSALAEGLSLRDRQAALLVASVLVDVPSAAWSVSEKVTSFAADALLQLVADTAGDQREEAAWALWGLASTAQISRQICSKLKVRTISYPHATPRLSPSPA